MGSLVSPSVPFSYWNKVNSNTRFPMGLRWINPLSSDIGQPSGTITVPLSFSTNPNGPDIWGPSGEYVDNVRYGNAGWDYEITLTNNSAPSQVFLTGQTTGTVTDSQSVTKNITLNVDLAAITAPIGDSYLTPIRTEAGSPAIYNVEETIETRPIRNRLLEPYSPEWQAVLNSRLTGPQNLWYFNSNVPLGGIIVMPIYVTDYGNVVIRSAVLSQPATPYSRLVGRPLIPPQTDGVVEFMFNFQIKLTCTTSTAQVYEKFINRYITLKMQSLKDIVTESSGSTLLLSVKNAITTDSNTGYMMMQLENSTGSIGVQTTPYTISWYITDDEGTITIVNFDASNPISFYNDNTEYRVTGYVPNIETTPLNKYTLHYTITPPTGPALPEQMTDFYFTQDYSGGS